MTRLPSARELEILEAVTRQTYELAADELGISPATIRTTMQNLFRTLDVRSRAQALRELERRGIALPTVARRRPPSTEY